MVSQNDYLPHCWMRSGRDWFALRPKREEESSTKFIAGFSATVIVLSRLPSGVDAWDEPCNGKLG